MVKQMDKLKYFFSMVISWTILMLFVSRNISADNVIYAVGAINSYNPEVFNNNIYFGDGIITPRYISDFITKIFMTINGGSWGDASLFFTYVAVLIYSIAISNIGYRICKKQQMVISTLLTLLLVFADNRLAGFALIAVESNSIGLGLGFALLAISYVIGDEKKYNIAWIFASFSAIFHIHEAVYCCVAIFLIALTDCIINKKVLLKQNWMIIIAIITILIVVLPNMITDSMDVSDNDFVNIYAIIRHPHHLVPTAWGVDVIIKSFWINTLLLFIAIETIWLVNKDNVKEYCILLSLLILAWIFVLGITYVFTEIKPVAFISTMMCPKFFNYVFLIALIYIVKAIVKARDKGMYISSYALLLCVFLIYNYELANAIVFVAIMSVIIFVENQLESTDIPIKVFSIIDYVLVILLLCINLSKISVLRFMVLCFVVTVIGIIYVSEYKNFKYKTLITILSCILFMCISLYGRADVLDGERALRYTMGDELYDFAVEFREATGVDEQYIADPYATATTGWFQVVSERNCYVVYKVVPSVKNTVDDWYYRYQNVSGFKDRNISEIYNVMDTEKINYVLVEENQFCDFEKSEDFDLFMISSNDLYRMYKKLK